jgi:hypothetical protein
MHLKEKFVSLISHQHGVFMLSSIDKVIMYLHFKEILGIIFLKKSFFV